MAGLVPAIYVLRLYVLRLYVLGLSRRRSKKTWMAGINPAMTVDSLPIV
jgi:hypothetical protein